MLSNHDSRVTLKQLDGLMMSQAETAIINGQIDTAIHAAGGITEVSIKNKLLIFGIEKGAYQVCQFLINTGCSVLIVALHRMQDPEVIRHWKSGHQAFFSELLNKLIESNRDQQTNLSDEEDQQEILCLPEVLMTLLKGFQSESLEKLLSSPWVLSHSHQTIPKLLDTAITLGEGKMSCCLTPFVDDIPSLLAQLLRMQSFYTKWGWKTGTYDEVYNAIIKKVASLGVNHPFSNEQLIQLRNVCDYLVKTNPQQLLILKEILCKDSTIDSLAEYYKLFLKALSISSPDLFLVFFQDVKLDNTHRECLKSIFDGALLDGNKEFAQRMIAIARTKDEHLVWVLSSNPPSANQGLFSLIWSRKRQNNDTNSVNPGGKIYLTPGMTK